MGIKIVIKDADFSESGIQPTLAQLMYEQSPVYNRCAVSSGTNAFPNYMQEKNGYLTIGPFTVERPLNKTQFKVKLKPNAEKFAFCKGPQNGQIDNKSNWRWISEDTTFDITGMVYFCLTVGTGDYETPLDSSTTLSDLLILE